MTDENLPSDTSKSSCLKTIGVTILVLFVLAVPAIFWAFHMVMGVPRFRHFAECAEQAQEIGAALNRYERKFDTYPTSLDELYPRFIDDRQILHCPEDPSPRDRISYEYKRPAVDAPDDAIMIVCRRHVLFSGQPAVMVAVRKDGNIVKPSAISTDIRPAAR